MSRLRHEIAKFGTIGVVAYVVDLSVFNLLRVGGPLEHKPLTAKAISVALATTVAFFGNRNWTYRDRSRESLHREYLMFVVLNLAGMAIALACLAISHYGLNLRSPLADNISANGVGLVLGTLFRFWSYRRFVFIAR